jgi:hypothetical protein
MGDSVKHSVLNVHNNLNILGNFPLLMESFNFKQKTIRRIQYLHLRGVFRPIIARYKYYSDQWYNDSILTNNFAFLNLQDASLTRITHFNVFQRFHKCSKVQGMCRNFSEMIQRHNWYCYGTAAHHHKTQRHTKALHKRT